MSQLGILVLYDSVLLCNALCALVSQFSDMAVVGATQDQDALRLAKQLRPQVLLLDIAWFDEPHTGTIQTLQAILPKLRIIAVSYQGKCDTHVFLSVIHRGIRGYLCGQENSSEVASAIRMVAAGDVYLCPGASDVLVKSFRRLVPPAG